MEYALKATGFRLRNSKKAEADWDSFAKGLSDLRERNETRVKAAIQLFDTEPPRKQIVDGNSLGWKDVPLADGSNVELFLAVRRIRNNLFHGGKTPFIPRDKDLLDAGLALMTIALALHSGVRKNSWSRTLTARSDPRPLGAAERVIYLPGIAATSAPPAPAGEPTGSQTSFLAFTVLQHCCVCRHVQPDLQTRSFVALCSVSLDDKI